MKGLIRVGAAWLLCAAAVVGAGCCSFPLAPTAQELTGCSNHLYDRCYPQRYVNLADREVNAAMTPQVQNGHVLDQTVWNHFFEQGTDRLTPGGQDLLSYLSRRRPQPDTTIYLATASDLPYDPNCPDRYCGSRQELDARRVVAVQKYLTALNCGRPVDFQVLVHDPADPSLATTPVASSITQMYGRFRGGLLSVAGGAGGGGGAGVSAGTSTGGGGR
jgi:hypothetical protein